MWRWMPDYLRWYLRGMAAPIAVGTFAAAAFVASLRLPPWSESPVLVHRTTAIVCAAGVACALLLARSLRGRTRLVDALHAPIWMQPWHAAALGAIPFGADLASSAVASLVLLGGSCGPLRLAKAAKVAAERLRPRSLVRALGLGLLVAAIWIAHSTVPREVPGGGLDGAWRAALDRAVILNLRAGVDYVFTFGPLGALSTGAYTPELFGFKLLAWTGAVHLGLAILMVRIALRMRGALDRILFLVLLLYAGYPDAYVYLGILAATAWVLRRERATVGPALLALAAIAVFALAKFSYAIAGIFAALVLLIVELRSSTRGRGVLLGVAGVAIVLLLWWTSGQRIADLAVWIRRSLELSDGYAKALSTTAPPGTLGLAAGSIGLLALQCALLWRGHPARFRGAAIAAVALAVTWVAFKGAFVRASDHATMFFGFTLLAPFVLAASSPVGRTSENAGRLCRLACVALGLAGIARADLSPSTWTQRFLHATKSFRQKTALLIDLAGARRHDERDLADARRRASLPLTRAAVGDRSIDAVSIGQGSLFLDDLRWTPRPAFQSYLTFSPELMALNERFFRGERASDFVLFRLDPIDDHLATMEDALALRVLARDYAPVLEEGGFLLLRREPRKSGPEAPEPELETRISFGQRIDFPHLEGRAHLLALDIAPTLRGRVRSFLLEAPALVAEVGLDSGETVRARIVPDMMRVGAIFDPYLRTQSDWTSWIGGGKPPRPVWLRILPPSSPAEYRAEIGVRILRDGGIAPR
jgi:hypothetical protein